MNLPRSRRTLAEKLKHEAAITAPKKSNVKKGIFPITMPVVAPQTVKDYKVITTAAELIEYLQRCEETGLCGFDYETTVSEEYRKIYEGICRNLQDEYQQAEAADDKKAMKGFEKAMDAATEDFLKAPLDPWKAEICTVSLSAAPNEARVIFINNPGENQFKTAAFVTTEGRRNLVFDVLDQYLFRSRKITKIAVNLAFETKQTAKLGKYILSPVADPLIMWVRCMQIMAPEKIPNPKFPASGKGLKPMTKEVFGVEMTPFEQVLEERGVNFFAEISADDPAAVEYSAEDSDYAVQHYLYWREIAKQIPKYDKWLHEIEMPFTRVIGAMEFGGMRF